MRHWAVGRRLCAAFLLHHHDPMVIGDGVVVNLRGDIFLGGGAGLLARGGGDDVVLGGGAGLLARGVVLLVGGVGLSVRGDGLLGHVGGSSPRHR